MNQKYKSIIAIILAVWIFAIGVAVGKDIGTEANLAQQQTTEAAVAEKPTKPNLGGSINTGTNTGTNNGGTTDNGNNGGTTDNGNNQPAPSDPSQYTDEQIVQLMNYYVNLVKAESNMTATKTESIKVTVTDCSVPQLIGTINGIVEGIIGDGGETVTYTFVNDREPGGGTPFSLIPPTSKEFKVSTDGIADASATVDANGNVTYTVILVAEETTLTSPEPFYNSTAIGYLNLANLDVAPAEISQADMKYPGSTVSVTVDSNDRVIKLYNKLPMTGAGKAGIGFAKGSADFEGALDETWEFSYN